MTYLGVGALAGTAAGLFGVGGGLIIVPALVYFAGLSQHRAVGTSLTVLLLPVGLGAVVEYYRHGNVDLRAAGFISVALFLGAWASGRFAQKVSPIHLKMAFGLFAMVMGAYVFFSTLTKIRKGP